MTRAILSMALAVWAGSAAHAADDVTIVFNVDLRAFVCWVEGPAVIDQTATAIDGCPIKGAHPFRDNLHFYRGQRISVQLYGARLAESYSVAMKAEDLVVPGIPVYGGMDALPSLVGLGGTSQLVLPGGFAPAAPMLRDLAAEQLYPNLDKASEADFKAFLADRFLTAATLPQVAALTGHGVALAIDRSTKLLAPGSVLGATGSALEAEIATVHGTLSRLRPTYCGTSPKGGTFADTVPYFASARQLRQVIDRTKAWHAEIDTAGLAAATTAIAAAQAAATAASAVLDIQIEVPAGDPNAGLLSFIGFYEAAFPQISRTTRIAGITIEKGIYVQPGIAGNEFFALLNQNAITPSTPATADSLARLKANLTTFAATLPQLRAAAARLVEAQKSVTALRAFTASKEEARSAVFGNRARDIGLRTIDAAEMANCIAQNMPLPSGLSVPLSDAWYGSKQITVSLTRGTRLPLFDISAARNPIPEATPTLRDPLK